MWTSKKKSKQRERERKSVKTYLKFCQKENIKLCQKHSPSFSVLLKEPKTVSE